MRSVGAPHEGNNRSSRITSFVEFWKVVEPGRLWVGRSEVGVACAKLGGLGGMQYRHRNLNSLIATLDA